MGIRVKVKDITPSWGRCSFEVNEWEDDISGDLKYKFVTTIYLSPKLSLLGKIIVGFHEIGHCIINYLYLRELLTEGRYRKACILHNKWDNLKKHISISRISILLKRS